VLPDEAQWALPKLGRPTWKRLLAKAQARGMPLNLESRDRRGQGSVALRLWENSPQTGKGLEHLQDGAVSAMRCECKA